MIINFDNIGGGGGGGQYVLPVATANRLGGIKVGSGLTIDNSGVLSTSGGTAPSGDNIKVYIYDELYSGNTYDHSDLTILEEMRGLSMSGTPVYVLYRNEHKTVYMELNTIVSNAQMVFYGFDGTNVYYCMISIEGDYWIMSNVSQKGVGDYMVVDALSAITDPTEGMIATERIGYGEKHFTRLYILDPNNYEQEGYWGIVKDSEGNDRDDIYFNSNWFLWAWETGNNNPNEWVNDNERGYIYRCNFDTLDMSKTTFDIIFLHEGDYVELKGGGQVYIGISAATEAYEIPEQPQIYQHNKWTPLYPVFEFNGFKTTAQTAEFMTLVRDMVSLGRYPSIFYKTYDRNVVLNYEGDDEVWITFAGEKEWDRSFRIYFSPSSAGDNGFDEAGVRVDENLLSIDIPSTFIVFGVADDGTIGGDVNYIKEESTYFKIWFVRNYDQSCQEECERSGWGQLKWVNRYKTLVYNEDSQENEEKWYWIFSSDIPVETTIYTGVWGFLDAEEPTIETLSWTSGATYESQNYPIYTGSTGE